MPKPTFENLPADKRQRIVEIAIAEFADHPYALASVSQIAERASIAKGSIYQYFENKQALFLFLVDHAAQAQLELLRALTPPDPGLDFFALLRWQMSASVQVGIAAPQLVRLLARGFSNDLPFRDQVVRRMGAAGEAHFYELLRLGIERGELDPALDLELAAFVLRQLTGELGALIARRLATDVQVAIDEVERFAGPEAEQIYDGILRILKHGLAAPAQI